MTAKEFFWNVAEMRSAQKTYFSTRDQGAFRAARKLENMIDHEIDRVRGILHQQEQEGGTQW